MKGMIELIGDKRLELPNSYNKTFQILDMFKIAATDSKNINMHNAKRLVELNNEVYDRLFEKMA
jgi:hypothetical protein